MKRKLLFPASWLLAIVISVVGLFFKKTWITNTALIVAFIVASALPILFFVLNIISSKMIVKKFNSLNVAETNKFLVSHRDDAEKTAKEKLKELQHIRFMTGLYSFVIFVLAIVISVFGGVMVGVSTSLYTILTAYSAILFFVIFSRINKKIPIVLTDDAQFISKNDYPLINSLARKAADSVGCNEQIIILPNWGFTASIIKDQKKAYLQIGVMLLHILTEEELYAILLHEFAHITKENDPALRETQYNRWLTEDGGITNALTSALSHLYMYFITKYFFTYMIYRYSSAVVEELRADKIMAEHSNKKIAVSALLKCHYDSMYSWELGVNDEASVLEDEELKPNYLTNKIEAFKKAMNEKSEFWNELVTKEIISNSATHPTLKMRMDIMGVEKVELTESTSSDEYISEIQKLLDTIEKQIYSDRQKTYEKDRDEYYLTPLAKIEAWKQEGSPITPESYADIISDMKSIGKHKEAEALCDRVIQELPRLSAANAIFMKGCSLLHRYDESGLEMIYKAIEQNGNYTEEGLETIGLFCCLTGRCEQLLEYREKAAQIGQKHIDNNTQISFLSKKDNLTKENLPDGLLEEILTYIKSIDQGIIENIYLVRKTVSESFFASVFIIHFYGGTDAQRDEILHKIFRFLDSHPADWHFALFDYFDYPEVKVEKIEGSLVYTKNKGDKLCQH